MDNFISDLMGITQVGWIIIFSFLLIIFVFIRMEQETDKINEAEKNFEREELL